MSSFHLNLLLCLCCTACKDVISVVLLIHLLFMIKVQFYLLFVFLRLNRLDPKTF